MTQGVQLCVCVWVTERCIVSQVMGQAAHNLDSAKQPALPSLCPRPRVYPAREKFQHGSSHCKSHCCVQSLPERGLPCHLYCLVTCLGSLEKWLASSASHWSACDTENMTTHWTVHCLPPPELHVNKFLAVWCSHAVRLVFLSYLTESHYPYLG